jgi:hypothetical protein
MNLLAVGLKMAGLFALSFIATVALIAALAALVYRPAPTTQERAQAPRPAPEEAPAPVIEPVTLRTAGPAETT